MDLRHQSGVNPIHIKKTWSYHYHTLAQSFLKQCTKRRPWLLYFIYNRFCDFELWKPSMVNDEIKMFQREISAVILLFSSLHSVYSMLSGLSRSSNDLPQHINSQVSSVSDACPSSWLFHFSIQPNWLNWNGTEPGAGRCIIMKSILFMESIWHFYDKVLWREKNG